MEIVPEIGRRDYRNTRADGRTAVVEAARTAERNAKLRAPLLETPAEKAAAIETITRSSPSCATEIQVARVLRVLREVGPTTCMEFRRYADIMHAPRRILDLRQAGHDVVADWVCQLSEAGRSHRTARYTLVRERAAEAAS